ncbi:diguanylate cyclase [bacterium]|nr:diguanylate cyclase [bacterium]
MALWSGYSLAQNALWLFFLIASLYFLSARLIVRGSSSEYQFLLIFPLIIITIWQFSYSRNVDISPFLYLTSAFFFFAFSLKNAFLSSVCLLIMCLIAALKGTVPLEIFLWLVLSVAFWALLFTVHLRETDLIIARFENMHRRAKGFISPVKQQSISSIMPDLDSETQLAKATASAFRLETLMDWVTEIIHEVMHPHSCFFFFLDQQEGNLKVLAYKSKSRFFEANTIIEVNSPGILSWVVQHKQKIRPQRLHKELQHPEYYKARERILTCVVFPVIIDDRVEGILGIDGRRSYSFGVDEDQLMNLFARLTADMVKAFRIYQQKEYHADYMEAFYRAVKQIVQARLDLNTRLDLLLKISSMIKKSDEAAVAVPKDDGSIVIRKARGDYFPRLVGAVIHDKSTCGKILKSGKEISVLDPEEFYQDNQCLLMPGETKLKIKNLMLVALPVQNGLKGVLLLGSRKRDYFTHNDRFVFSTLAAQFGVAIENAINLAKIQELAITDGLTGLYNHRYFQDFLVKEVKLAEREKSSFSLIILDIDHFKKFNDTWGHQTGDEVLKHLAGLLLEQAREIDIVARYGGEEFVIILRQCELKMAAKIAERIRKTCDRSKITADGETLHITISLGVSNFPNHAKTPAELISVADSALYVAKKAGRNRVEVADF